MTSKKGLRFYFFFRMPGSQNLESTCCDSNSKSESSNVIARSLFKILVMTINTKCNLTGKQQSTNEGFKENSSFLFLATSLFKGADLTFCIKHFTGEFLHKSLLIGPVSSFFKSSIFS